VDKFRSWEPGARCANSLKLPQFFLVFCGFANQPGMQELVLQPGSEMETPKLPQFS